MNRKEIFKVFVKAYPELLKKCNVQKLIFVIGEGRAIEIKAYDS